MKAIAMQVDAILEVKNIGRVTYSSALQMLMLVLKPGY
jgi:hypothetical protein